ncbi:hypothetical protein C3432_01845 [Citrobacter amalonaticus]|uniref:Uncharacterized protein n=1 Tax=Citrobacter amalonaticus TaxID=35703 RepID=A0A2S4S2I0_CITAM|nr:hypothetical protein [Citrobacter amalonaticus]POT59489.1 hypothetical protein C3432_01845 [Citrobacter amalonaticus]POT77619.1 hypothetical protein C3436_09515 [Citrobacter amalonaticus]POU68071.1 hypothetical protein C3430_03050 [Citrobacter amalonaticus]POV07675.1 hypothetical protein C3424_03060 [Citrobacter amalonaticus]
MISVNKSFLRSIQDNALTSTEKDVESANDRSSVSVKNTSLRAELSDVKNVFKSYSSASSQESLRTTKGLLAEDFQSKNISPASDTVAASGEQLHINAQKRIDDIVKVLLPEIDVSYQVARTACDNIDTNDLSKLDKMKKYVTTAYEQKRNLQDEAISLFLQMNVVTNDINHNPDAEQSTHKLFALIFNLSCSYDDVVKLLDSAKVTDSFLKFASDESNQSELTDLYGAFGKNSSNSLENEIMQTIK